MFTRITRNNPGFHRRASGNLFACLALALLFVQPSMAADSPANLDLNLKNLSHEIVYVRTFGTWSHNGRQGNHRVVLLDAMGEHPHSKLYMQWVIVAAGNPNDGVVLASTPIKEFNASGVYKLSVPKLDKDDSGVSLTALNQYSSDVENFYVKPGAPGEYALEYIAQEENDSIEQEIKNIPLSLDYYVRPTF